MTLPQTVNPVHAETPGRPAMWRFSLKGPLGGYVIGLITVGIATGLDVGLWDIIHPQASPLYIAAIMVTGWLGGLGPGLFATALAGGALVFLFIDPVYSFRIAPPDMLRLAVFLAVALLISWDQRPPQGRRAGGGSGAVPAWTQKSPIARPTSSESTSSCGTSNNNCAR